MKAHIKYPKLFGCFDFVMEEDNNKSLLELSDLLLFKEKLEN